MEIDYNAPLELNAILVELNVTGQVSGMVNYKVYVLWSDIVTVEEFVKPHLTPGDNRRKTNITTKYGNHLVAEPIEEVSQAWAQYRVWASKAPLFKFN
jgi:hypothetical protein